MTELRWLLLGIGVVILVCIYFLWGRNFSRKTSPSKDTPRRTEPSLDGAEEFADYLEGDSSSVPATDSPMVSDTQTGETSDDDKKIISIHVAAAGASRFAGSQVEQAFKAQGLRYGKYNIYHCFHDDHSDQVLFSVANMLEPGTFEPERMVDMMTPGLTFFMVLPGPMDGVKLFALMLEKAKTVARLLGGEVLDSQGSTMSNQAAGHVREEIIAYELRQKHQASH